MPLDITDDERAAIEQALRDDYFEGAVELVFAAFHDPDMTRDEAVDIVQEIEADMKKRQAPTWGVAIR